MRFPRNWNWQHPLRGPQPSCPSRFVLCLHTSEYSKQLWVPSRDCWAAAAATDSWRISKTSSLVLNWQKTPTLAKDRARNNGRHREGASGNQAKEDFFLLKKKKTTQGLLRRPVAWELALPPQMQAVRKSQQYGQRAVTPGTARLQLSSAH